MVQCIKPYGGVKESLVRFLISRDGKYYLVDESSNQWQIDEKTFKYLSLHGFQTKEVRRKTL